MFKVDDGGTTNILYGLVIYNQIKIYLREQKRPAHLKWPLQKGC